MDYKLTFDGQTLDIVSHAHRDTVRGVWIAVIVGLGHQHDLRRTFLRKSRSESEDGMEILRWTSDKCRAGHILQYHNLGDRGQGGLIGYWELTSSGFINISWAEVMTKITKRPL